MENASRHNRVPALAEVSLLNSSTATTKGVDVAVEGASFGNHPRMYQYFYYKRARRTSERVSHKTEHILGLVCRIPEGEGKALLLRIMVADQIDGKFPATKTPTGLTTFPTPLQSFAQSTSSGLNLPTSGFHDKVTEDGEILPTHNIMMSLFGSNSWVVKCNS